MRLKSFWFIIALLMMFTLMLGACGQNETSGNLEENVTEDKGTNEQNDNTSDYPAKPISIIVPYGPGGDTDINARLFAKYLEEEINQTVVVTNIEGAGGSVGISELQGSEPDGYTVLFHHNSMLLLNVLGLTDIHFSDLKTAGVVLDDSTIGLNISAESEFNDLDGLVNYAKDNPGEVTAAASMGNLSHMFFLALQEAADIELNIVDVGGSQDQINAVKSGRADIFIEGYMLTEQHIESGDLKPIGIFAEERNDLVPDLPTLKEQGFDLIFPKSYFLHYPKETPDEIVNVLNEAMEKVTKNKGFIKETMENYFTPNYMPAQDAIKFFNESEDKYIKYKEELQQAK